MEVYWKMKINSLFFFKLFFFFYFSISFLIYLISKMIMQIFFIFLISNYTRGMPLRR